MIGYLDPLGKRRHIPAPLGTNPGPAARSGAVNSVWTQRANVSPRTQAVPEARPRALVPRLLGLAAFVSPPSETSPDSKGRWRREVSSGRFPAVAGEHGCILSSRS